MAPVSYRAWLRAPAKFSLILRTRMPGKHVLKILIDPFCPKTCPGTTDGPATFQARTRSTEMTYEVDGGDGSGCGNGRSEIGGAPRAPGGNKRRRCSDSCVGIHRG